VPIGIVVLMSLVRVSNLSNSANEPLDGKLRSFWPVAESSWYQELEESDKTEVGGYTRIYTLWWREKGHSAWSRQRWMTRHSV